jgi:hypothetical protein
MITLVFSDDETVTIPDLSLAASLETVLIEAESRVYSNQFSRMDEADNDHLSLAAFV